MFICIICTKTPFKFCHFFKNKQTLKNLLTICVAGDIMCAYLKIITEVEVAFINSNFAEAGSL